jgi:hypothetical protein
MTMEEPPERYTRRMVADPREFAGVRRTVRAQLNGWGQEGFADAAVMCVTEILANVHRHVESPECELWLEKLPEGGLRLAVSDGSAQPPVLVNRELYAEGGRGMALVTGVADRWWTEPVGAGGKRVWVVLCEQG